jgi:hypothetical protein
MTKKEMGILKSLKNFFYMRREREAWYELRILGSVRILPQDSYPRAQQVLPAKKVAEISYDYLATFDTRQTDSAIY